MIKILIANDSTTETELLKKIFEAEQDMHVIACAHNGKEAIELAEKLKPDLITMDIQMPIMNGFEATQQIMMQNPIPIVMISSNLGNKDLNTTVLALEAGAVSVIEAPLNTFNPDFKLTRQRMVDLIRAMAEIKVIKRKFTTLKNKITSPDLPELKQSQYELIAIGASVGGPQVLKKILFNLPTNFPIPIVIVQHMTVGFIQGFCQWLDEHCHLSVKCAENQEILKPGTVYFAPEHNHLTIKRINTQLLACLQKGAPVSGFCPSITTLLQSVADVSGSKAIGMLLTGMGKDGAQGLLDLKQKKGHTLIQDPKSCVVYGMAKVAQSLGAVDKIIDVDEIAGYFISLTS